MVDILMQLSPTERERFYTPIILSEKRDKKLAICFICNSLKCIDKKYYLTVLPLLLEDALKKGQSIKVYDLRIHSQVINEIISSIEDKKSLLPFWDQFVAVAVDILLIEEKGICFYFNRKSNYYLPLYIIRLSLIIVREKTRCRFFWWRWSEITTSWKIFFIYRGNIGSFA